MKLLVQADDFGITPAVCQGIVAGIQKGIVRNTGAFVNLPWFEECYREIAPFLDQIAFGIDLNMSAGAPVSALEQVPSLLQENGQFLTSKMNKALDNEANHFDHVKYDEVYIEFNNQIEKFIKITGRKPDYLHAHAYGTKTSYQVIQDLARKYDVISSFEVLGNPQNSIADMSWYRFGTKLDEQLKNDLKQYLLEDRAGFLKGEPDGIGCLVTHCGYVDAPLFDLSSYTLFRIRDLEALTSPEVLEWVKQNQIELITYKDLKDKR